MNVGNKLRFIRETKKISIYKLSKDTGISQNHISWGNGSLLSKHSHGLLNL